MPGPLYESQEGWAQALSIPKPRGLPLQDEKLQSKHLTLQLHYLRAGCRPDVKEPCSISEGRNHVQACVYFMLQKPLTLSIHQPKRQTELSSSYNTNCMGMGIVQQHIQRSSVWPL